MNKRRRHKVKARRRRKRQHCDEMNHFRSVTLPGVPFVFKDGSTVTWYVSG